MHHHCASTICPNQASLCFFDHGLFAYHSNGSGTPLSEGGPWNVFRLWVSFHQSFFFFKETGHTLGVVTAYQI